jgi:aminopeptidase-like protein
MNTTGFLRDAESGVGDSMLEFMQELYPICRSITGDGLRQTLHGIARHVPIVLHEVPSGTRVFDWTVPKEWNVRDAYIADSDGRRVVDFRRSNLHVLNYSTPVRARMSLADLRPHLHTLPAQPDWIPYRTSYYREDWGFCLRQNELDAMTDSAYEVVIDSELRDGSLTYGELFLPGRRQDEILLSTHCCHPSLCNDNLSGIAVLTWLARALGAADRGYSYRILFLPGTIGAIVWLARNQRQAHRIRHGLVLSGVGDAGPIHYKRSRRGDARIDRVVARALRARGAAHRLMDFSPYGYDERQFCSPGFDLPVGRFSRSEYGSYPQYHTSADDFDFVSAASLADSYAALVEILNALESEAVYRRLDPHCEPQLGKRGLYDDLARRPDWEALRLALLWVLNLADGEHSLEDMAERAGIELSSVRDCAAALQQAQLIERCA